MTEPKKCPLCGETDILEEDSRRKCTNCSCEAMYYDWDTRANAESCKPTCIVDVKNMYNYTSKDPRDEQIRILREGLKMIANQGIAINIDSNSTPEHILREVNSSWQFIIKSAEQTLSAADKLNSTA